MGINSGFKGLITLHSVGGRWTDT